MAKDFSPQSGGWGVQILLLSSYVPFRFVGVLVGQLSYELGLGG